MIVGSHGLKLVPRKGKRRRDGKSAEIGSRKLSRGLDDQSTLRTFLALSADCCCLRVYGKQDFGSSSLAG